MKPQLDLSPMQFLSLWPTLIDPNIDYRIVFYVYFWPPSDWRPNPKLAPKPGPVLVAA